MGQGQLLHGTNRISKDVSIMANQVSRIHKAIAMIDHAVGQQAAWAIGGSTGLMLRGMQLGRLPRDLDLYADAADARLIHEALLPFAIDGPLASDGGIYSSILSHYNMAGVHVELVGAFVVQAQATRYDVRVRGLLLPHAAWVRPEGHERAVPLVPLAHELLFNVLRGRGDRIALIEAYMRVLAADEGERQRLERIQTAFAAAYKLPPATAAKLTRWAGGSTGAPAPASSRQPGGAL